jgi:hypothetical protein
MIHLHFGKLQEWYRHNGGVHYRGEYGLMIEFAQWRAQFCGKRGATCRSSRRDMDRVLPWFLGARLSAIDLQPSYSILAFERRSRLEMWPSSSQPEPLCQWAMFRGDQVAVTLDGRGRFFSKAESDQLSTLTDLLSSSGRRAINLLTHDQLFSAKATPGASGALLPGTRSAVPARTAPAAIVEHGAEGQGLEDDDDPLAVIIRKACSRWEATSSRKAKPPGRQSSARRDRVRSAACSPVRWRAPP